MILEDVSNKRFGVPSSFEFFMIFPIFYDFSYFLDFPKNEGFLENEVISPEEAGNGHPRGMPACMPCRIALHRPALRKSCTVAVGELAL